MKIIILGADGYLGWPTAMHLAVRGHEVLAVDNYSKRQTALEANASPLFHNPDLVQRSRLLREAHGASIHIEIGDCTDHAFLRSAIADFKPDGIVHYAEQPSGPWSMIGYDQARRTLENNLGSTLALIWAVIHESPDCPIVKLGTMGEYGTPNIDIEEGWIEVEHNGRQDKFLFPRAAGSLYHTTKILDTDLLHFYVRMHDLRVTDLMQGPVYGLETAESGELDALLPHFYYDDIFGTCLNRFLVQALVGEPLTVYGEGGQTRGYLNIRDTVRCVELALTSPPSHAELRVFNQFTQQFSVRQLADLVCAAAPLADLPPVSVATIKNPRREPENHYYNAAHTGLLELGLEPHLLDPSVLAAMLNRLSTYRGSVDPSKIQPRVSWKSRG